MVLTHGRTRTHRSLRSRSISAATSQKGGSGAGTAAAPSAIAAISTEAVPWEPEV